MRLDATNPIEPDDLTSLFDLGGRVAVVTGGTRGIGLVLAQAFAAAGAKVVVAGRKAEGCARAAETIVSGGGEAIGVATHMGDVDAVRSLVAQAVEAFGGIDILVNNAATPLSAPVGEITPELMDKSFDVNVKGPLLLVQEALPHLRQSDSAVVLNVASAGPFIHSPRPGTGLYTAAKAALVALTRTMAAELIDDGIRVNALAPGTIGTEMMSSLPDEELAAIYGQQLQKRAASPRELVGPALLLVSDAGSFITAQVLFADGGMVVAR